MDFKGIVKLIGEKKNIAIVTHVAPDGDAVGSTLALTEGLRALGKNAVVVSRDKAPDNLSFLSLYEEYAGTAPKVPEGTEVVIALDCGNKDRLSMDLDTMEGHPVVNIDHHLSNDFYGDLNYVDTKASAVGEIIFLLLRELGVEITAPIAESLYAAIVSDCGSFRFESTTGQTHAIAKELVETGIDFPTIHRNLFESRDFSRLKLLGKALDSLEEAMDGYVTFMYLHSEDFNSLSISDRDSGDIVNYGLESKTCEVSVLLKEAEGFFRVSLRTKTQLDARVICEAFEGGGHVRAAGCNIKAESVEEAKRLLLDVIGRMRLEWTE